MPLGIQPKVIEKVCVLCEFSVYCILLDEIDDSFFDFLDE